MDVPAGIDPHRRERAIAFARFTWRRFLDDKCFEAAGAMSYTTLFSLVPLSVAAFGIIAELFVRRLKFVVQVFGVTIVFCLIECVGVSRAGHCS